MRSPVIPALAVAGAASLCLWTSAPSAKPEATLVGTQSKGVWLVPTNQIVSPIGTLRHFNGGRPKDMALSPDGETVAILCTDRLALFTSAGQAIAEVKLKADPLGVVFSPDGNTVYASGTDGQVLRVVNDGGTWGLGDPLAAAAAPPVKPGADEDAESSGDVTFTPGGKAVPVASTGDPQVTGLAISPDGKRLYAALSIRNAVAVLDTATGQVTRNIPVGVAPFRILLSKDGRTLYVANRGGVPAREDEPSAPSAGTATRIDPATDASLRGNVSAVDTGTWKAETIEAGRQPAGLALSPDGRRLYIANSDDDTVNEVDTATRKRTRSLSLRPEDDPIFGQMPMDAAVSPDGTRLYISCSGANAVAVVRLSTFQVDGYIPAGWGAIAARPVGQALVVASSKGEGSRWKNKKGAYAVHRSVGMVQFIPNAGALDLPALTRTVAHNNRWAGAELPARKGAKPVPIPERVGEPSVFKHVVYIIKENHTYDADLGDMPEGNGDPDLVSYGEKVTPNEHALSRQFVLLDNTYSSGTNSAEGHQWTDSAIANAYMEQEYTNYQRSYGSSDPLTYSPKGFLWTSAIRKGTTLRVYGEGGNHPVIRDKVTGKTPTWSQLWEDRKAGANKYEIRSFTDKKALRPYMHPVYISFPQIVSDQWRADVYLKDLEGFEKTGRMPALSILALPDNHTSGTKPGMPRPASAVADNDLALGRIVDGISHSRFWKDTLILVIEDDSQHGVDHVDGHRTVAFCISPYTRRGQVVSVPYNHTSLVRTIGLVLGFPAMTRFDRTATPLTACFSSVPDFSPYTHKPNQTPLDDLNPPLSALKGEALALAKASMRQDFSEVDRADFTVLARAAWSQQNAGRPFPWRYFHPPAHDDDDD